MVFERQHAHSSWGQIARLLCIFMIRVVFIAWSLLTLSGCSHLLGVRPKDYRTIDSSPYHDTDRARRQNDDAITMIEKGKLDRAEKLLQEALIADVTFAPAHNNLGQLYFLQGKMYLAAWEFEYARELMEDRPEPHNNLGLVYESVGRLDQAIEMFSGAYALDSENPVYIGNLARARLRRGDRDEETAHLLDELRIYDTRPDWLAWAHYELAAGGAASVSKGDEEGMPISSTGVITQEIELLPRTPRQQEPARPTESANGAEILPTPQTPDTILTQPYTSN